MNSRSTSHILQPTDPAYKRYCQRLKDDLGLDHDAIEIIVELRNQIMLLQTRLRTVESALELYKVSQSTRLAKYREVVEDVDREEI